MKKYFITLCAMMAMCVASFTSMAAVQQVYVCGSINGQGWKPGPSTIRLSDITDGWFKLDVTLVGEFKVSSTVGSKDDDWTGFDKGAVKFDFGTKALNAVYDKNGGSWGNSTVPAGTKAIYFSSDLTKAAISDGTWTPDAYVEGENPDPDPSTYTVSVDATIPGWTSVKCHYWGGNTSDWPGEDMTDNGNGVWSITLDQAPENILFHNGDGDQSVDFTFTDGKTYVLRSRDANQKNYWCEESGDDPNPDPQPADVKFFRDVNGTWTELALTNGSYSLTVATGETVYFTFTTGSWNGAWRPAGSSDETIADNGTYSASGSGSGCYIISTPGTYTLTPYANKTFTVSGFGGNRPVEGLSNTLPVLYINIYQTNEDGSFKLDNQGNKIYDNYQLQVEEIDKVYRPGEYWLDMNGCTIVPGENIGSAEAPLPLEMKGRGNWTRKGFAKKPFKLKLGAKQVLLGMGQKSKHWAILAHADDNCGYLRNFTGFNLGKRIGLPWTPSQQPVEVVINGNYRGLYFLTESIRVGDGRVPVEELADNETQPDLISGGYLVELDNYDETNQIQFSEQTCVSGQFLDVLRVTFDTPEEYSTIQKRFVSEQFEAMNNLVGKANTSEGDALWSYLDLDDAARYYLVEEICSHTESYHGSTYLFRDRGEGQKWHFSPLWDMGNAFNGSTDAFFYDCDPFGNTWIPSLRQNEKFNAKVRETWKWFMSNCYEDLMNDIDEYVSTISEAAKADKARWDGQPTPANGQPVVDNSDMNAKKQVVVNHLNSKINWLKNKFGDYAGIYAEPERDTTPAAKLPDYALTGIEDIEADNNAAPVYYNLQGIRVASPAVGSIYIEVRGSQSRKVTF